MVKRSTVQIEGPAGALEAEVIDVEGAEHTVVIVPGSGAVDRDGNSGGSALNSNTYKLLAEGIARHGISSIRIDKRGLFGSRKAINNPNNVTVEDYAMDVRRWTEYAIRFAPNVWIAGHSEGGLVSLVVASNPPSILRGLILLATPGRPLAQIMLEQFGKNEANMPLMPEVESILERLEMGAKIDFSNISPPLRQIFHDEILDFLIDLFSYDPAKIALGWKGSTLLVQGDKDIQILQRDADNLARSLKDVKRVNLSQGTHMLKAQEADDLYSTYTNPSLPLHASLVPSIVDFVKKSRT